MQCPLLYRFRVIDRLPEQPSPAATRGTVVHSVLERLFDFPAEERTPEQARALLRPEWERMLAARPELAGLFTSADDTDGPCGTSQGGAGQHDTEDSAGEDNARQDGAEPDPEALASWLSEAERLVERYFRLEDPRLLQPAEREAFVETQLDSGLTLRGVIDRVDVAPTGDVRVVDYKTGKAPSRDFEAKALFQMKFYALVLWRLRGVVPRRLQLVYLGGQGEVVSYDPEESELVAVERKLRALWEAISRATRTGHWPAKPSRLCGWCDHQARCPEFGGTPPPYPLPVE